MEAISSNHAAFALDLDGAVAWLNRRAHEFIRAGLVERKSGRLFFVDEHANTTTNDLIQRACQLQMAQDTVFCAHGNQHSEIEVMVRPLDPERNERKSCVVYLHDPKNIVELNNHALTTLYGMTAAEVSIVTLIVKGKSIEDIAEARCTTTPTTRSHLHRILRKTKCSTQGQLIARILTGLAYA